MRSSLILVSFLGLAACGGGAGSNTVSLNVPGFSSSGSTTVSGVIVHFGTVDYSGETSTGEMSASVLSTSFESGAGFSESSMISNNVVTTLPVSGGGSFAGSYVGSWGEPTGPMDVVYGDADLAVADWSAPAITGTISNRRLLLGDGPSVLPLPHFADIALGSAAIDAAGVFTGVATGGEQVFSGATVTGGSNVGTFNGIVGGATGTEVAGQVFLSIDYSSGETFSETGVFLAE